MFPRVGLLAVLAAAASCSRSEVKTTGSAAPDPVPARPSFTVFAVAEMRGQIGPCGKGSPPSFELVVFFEKATVGTALADATKTVSTTAAAKTDAKSGDAAATPTPAATKEGATP